MALASSLKLIFTAPAVLASVLTAEPGPAHADEPEKRTISLSATGAVKTKPDEVTITTGVTSEGQTARAALDKNTEAMTKVVDGLMGAGIAAKEIQTTNFSVSPIYERKGKNDHAAFITGYRVNNQLHIRLLDTKKLGEVLDKVVSLGANKIGSIQFGVSEPEELEDEARKQAMKNAIANAELYAEAAGVELGPVLTITEDSPGRPIPRYAAEAAPVAMGEAVPIEAGTATVEVQLRVTWELR
jgi:uncharacterized protein YggE